MEQLLVSVLKLLSDGPNASNLMTQTLQLYIQQQGPLSEECASEVRRILTERQP